MNKPFTRASLAALYIVIIVFVVQGVGAAIKSMNGTLVIPMTMLSLFVLSAAIMGYLFLGEPLQLFLEGHKKESISFFAKVVGFFACFVALFAILLFIVR